MKLNLTKLFGVVTAITISLCATAQPSSGPPPGGSPSTGSTPPCWNPPCIPIDGGIGLLLAAGAFIGVRRIYKGSSEQQENQ